MLQDRILAFLSEFLGYECKSAEEFNQAMSTLDSLDQMDLVYKAEERFNIKIDEKIKINDFDDLARVIEGCEASAQSS